MRSETEYLSHLQQNPGRGKQYAVVTEGASALTLLLRLTTHLTLCTDIKFVCIILLF